MNETLTLEIEESEVDELPLLFEIDEHKLGMSIERMVKTATKPDSLSG